MRLVLPAVDGANDYTGSGIRLVLPDVEDGAKDWLRVVGPPNRTFYEGGVGVNYERK